MGISQQLTVAGLAAAKRLLGSSATQMVNCCDIGNLVDLFHEKYTAGGIDFIERSRSDVIDLLWLSADCGRAELLQIDDAPTQAVVSENIITLPISGTRSLADMLRSYYLGGAEGGQSGVLQRNIFRSLLGRSERYCSVVSRIAWAYEQILCVEGLGTGDRRAVRKLAFSSDLHFYSELARLTREQRDERLGMLIAEIAEQQ